MNYVRHDLLDHHKFNDLNSFIFRLMWKFLNSLRETSGYFFFWGVELVVTFNTPVNK